ncbi:UNVERIFIED_CONTAM: hypothetical protein Sangu_2532000 [Sesamum angustifolium]|uniref:MULE transposase domain-containing protein n=1 Tax=Sesamum angustifolium TaxID=2727405 RepID=A0AAW2JBE7_9LAMI
MSNNCSDDHYEIVNESDNGDTLREFVIQKGFRMKRYGNETQRVTTGCDVNGCSWRFHVSPLGDCVTFYIKAYSSVHESDSKKEARAKWMASKFIYRARRKAIEEIVGGHAESFAKLPYSTHMVSATNEVVLLHYNVHDDGSSSIIPIVPSFKKIFLGLLALSNGFMADNNPFIGFYGCHLKGPFGGVLLATIGLDWNNGLFLIAFDIAEMKCKKSWIFFFEHLSNMVGCFSHDRPWTFMSDRQKGLMETINEVILHAIHRKCVRHIYANFKHQFVGASLKKYLRVWDIRGIPCRHAALGITYMDNLENFTDNLFTKCTKQDGDITIGLVRRPQVMPTTKVNEGNPHGEISQFDMTAATNVPLADILQRIRGTKRKDQVDSSHTTQASSTLNRGFVAKPPAPVM